MMSDSKNIKKQTIPEAAVQTGEIEKSAAFTSHT